MRRAHALQPYAAMHACTYPSALPAQSSSLCCSPGSARVNTPCMHMHGGGVVAPCMHMHGGVVVAPCICMGEAGGVVALCPKVCLHSALCHVHLYACVCAWRCLLLVYICNGVHVYNRQCECHPSNPYFALPTPPLGHPHPPPTCSRPAGAECQRGVTAAAGGCKPPAGWAPPGAGAGPGPHTAQQCQDGRGVCYCLPAMLQDGW